MNETTNSKETTVNETANAPEAAAPPAETSAPIAPTELARDAAATPETPAETAAKAAAVAASRSPDRQATRRATTDVGALWSFGLAIPFYGLMVLAARFAPAGARSILLERGWPPHATMVLTALAVSILIVKAFGLRRQRRAFALDLLPGTEQRIGPEAAARIVDHVETVRGVRGARSFLVERVLRVLSQYATRGDVAEASAANDADADADASVVAASFSTVKVLVWAMPILGLIGTVIGLSGAVGAFSSAMSGAEQLDAIKDSLREVTTGLAVAFDATFVALVASILVMLPMTWLQKAEDKLVNDVDDYTVTNILARLGTSKKDAPRAKKRDEQAEIKKVVLDALAEPLAEMMSANTALMVRMAEDRAALAGAEGALMGQLAAFATTMANAAPAIERAVAQLEKTTAEVGPSVDRVVDGLGRATALMGSSMERVSTQLDRATAQVGPSLERAVAGLDKSTAAVGPTMERAVAELGRTTAQLEQVAAQMTERVAPGVERAVTQLEVATAVADQAASSAERAQDQLSRELGASRQLLSLLAAGLGQGDASPVKPRHANGTHGAHANGTNGSHGTTAARGG